MQRHRLVRLTKSSKVSTRSRTRHRRFISKQITPMVCPLSFMNLKHEMTSIRFTRTYRASCKGYSGHTRVHTQIRVCNLTFTYILSKAHDLSSLNRPSVKRVIVLSSCASISNPSDRGLLNESNWNTENIDEVNTKGREASQPAKYRASKSLAEKGARVLFSLLVSELTEPVRQLHGIT